MSKLRGHEIEEINGKFFYIDNGQPTAETWKERPCGHCGKHNTDKGHDACLGELPGVMNACCGHGQKSVAYVQFDHPNYKQEPNKILIQGNEAIAYIKKHSSVGK